MISSIPREPEQFLRLLAFFGARRFLLPARRLSRTLRNRNRGELSQIRPAGLRNSGMQKSRPMF